MAAQKKLLVEIEGTDNDGQYGTKSFKLPSRDDWSTNLQTINKKISKKFQVEEEYGLEINGQSVRYDDPDGLVAIMKDVDIDEGELVFKIIDISQVNSGANQGRKIVVHYNDEEFVHYADQELSKLDDDFYDEMYDAIKSAFKIRGKMGKIYEDVSGKKLYCDDWDDLSELLEDKEDGEALHLYIEGKGDKKSTPKSKGPGFNKTKTVPSPSQKKQIKPQKNTNEEKEEDYSNNALYVWCKSNGFEKYFKKLKENDIESLEDITETLETIEDIKDLAKEMNLKTVLKKKFIKAVMKLNNITQQVSQYGADSHTPIEEKDEKKEENKQEKKESEIEGRKKYDFKGVHQVDKLDNLSVGARNRTIMVIGETGTGKTTLLNSMMNYLWQVEYDDPYRFKLIYEGAKEEKQAESVTDDVTAYYLDPPALDYELTVIDTPGFGDTRGIKQDEKITKKIKKFFEEKVQEIDAICFVIRAPQARLTATSKYIFAQVLGIFGNDIVDNILILMPFADNKKPPALAALKAGNVPFKKHFKLNNSAFDLPGQNDDDDDDDDMFNRMTWKMGIHSFGKLFKAIDQLKTKSLQLTKKVLTRREELENYIESVQPTIRNGFGVLDRLRQHMNVCDVHGDEMDANKDFTYIVTVNKSKEISNNGEFNTTTCLECNYTCHKSCAYSDNADKENCSAMGSDGNCRNCPDKCNWKFHKNTPYTVEWYQDTETRTTQALKDKYYDAKNKQKASEQIMAGLVTEFAEIQQDLNALINNVRNCLNELGKIALRPNILSQDDYMDKLIQSEEAERKPGYQKRIGALRELKQKQDMLSKLNNDAYNPWVLYGDVTASIGKNKNIMTKVSKKHGKKQKNKKKGWLSSWF